MPIYNYKGYDAKSGSSRKGKIEADSPRAAKSRLRQKDGVIVSELKEEASLDKVKKKASLFATNSVKLQDLAVMARQFATLQRAGIPLDESLKALTAQVENVVLRNTLSAVREQVSEGKSLADALNSFPGVFNRLFINMVRAGESSGKLDVVLLRLADYTERQVEVRGQIFGAMTYPAVMILANVAIVAYLFISVVPQLQKVFDNLRVRLPWYTEMMIAISEGILSYWFVLLFGLLAVLFLFKRWARSPANKYKIDDFLLRLPVFGPLVLRINVSGFTRTLSTLLTSGVPIIRAIEITKNVVGNSVIAEILEKAKISVQEGENLGTVIDRSGRFPPLVVHMIMTGEKTGQLEQMLGHVSTAYDAEVERKISSMIDLIEPLMIIVMAGAAGGIIMALMVPMMSVMSSIR